MTRVRMYLIFIGGASKTAVCWKMGGTPSVARLCVRVVGSPLARDYLSLTDKKLSWRDIRVKYP